MECPHPRKLINHTNTHTHTHLSSTRMKVEVIDATLVGWGGAERGDREVEGSDRRKEGGRNGGSLGEEGEERRWCKGAVEFLL